MRNLQWQKHLTDSTAGRVLMMLRERSLTVRDLAIALSLTDGAVRAHLATLERDGLIERAESRPSASKPARTYRIVPEAEALFSRVYVPLLTEMLRVLDAEMDQPTFDATLRRVGRGLMAGRLTPTGSVAARAAAASALWNELGGLTTVTRDADDYLIRSAVCPLAAVVTAGTAVCTAMESLISEFVGQPVTKCCSRTTHMQCCFRLSAASPSAVP